MLKNRICAILLMLTLCVPAIAEPETPDSATALTPITQEVPENQLQENIREELPELNTIPYKQPVSKRKIAKKFLLAMSGVAISSIFLFVILSIYNKIRSGIIGAAKERKPETSLETPDSLTDAVRTFLEKTKWD